jgi:hypothetical protein
MSATERVADSAQPAQAVAPSEGVPPAGEEIHVPGGSVLPLVVAIGITLLVIGTTIWWVWSAVGFIIAAVACGIWIRDVRRDVDDLPEEHHHH